MSLFIFGDICFVYLSVAICIGDTFISLLSRISTIISYDTEGGLLTITTHPGRNCFQLLINISFCGDEKDSCGGLGDEKLFVMNQTVSQIGRG